MPAAPPGVRLRLYWWRRRTEAEEVPIDPEAVIELMSSAPQRYETVRAALRYRGDGPAIKALRERFSRSEAHRRTIGLPGTHPSAPSHPEPDDPFWWRRRVWLIDHNRWRVDHRNGGVIAHHGAELELENMCERLRLHPRSHPTRKSQGTVRLSR